VWKAKIKSLFAISIIRPAIVLLVLILSSLWSAQTAFAGSIVAWGDNRAGQCNIPSPNSDFIAIAAVELHSLGLKEDGSIIAWGSNGEGQCNIPSPNSGFIAIAAGGYHSLGLKQDSSIVAWGDNSGGQCDIPSPNSGFITISTGGLHSLGLKQDGSIVAWGSNYFGECNSPSPNSGFIAIAAGVFHSLGLKQDGSIVAWGTNYDGQCDIPSPNSSFIAIAAGWWHSLGLKQNGSIVAWGDNFYGQCNIPSPNSGFVAIAAGRHHSLGLKQDGSIVAWGDNDDGQCDIPSPNTGFIAIAAGSEHSLALKAEEPDAGLVGYWCFDEGSGNIAYDYSGNGNHGTISGYATWVQGYAGKALSFDPSDGSDEYVDCGNGPRLNEDGPYTVAAWFLANEVIPNEVIPYNNYTVCGKYSFGAEKFYLSICGGLGMIQVNDGEGGEFGDWKPITTSTPIQAGRWYHLVGVCSPPALKIYLNGSLENIRSDIGVVNNPIGNLFIGQHSPWYPRRFNGIIDEVRIYDRALNDTEIKILYSLIKTTIVGTVRDDVTQQAIANAEVFIAGMPHLTAKSDVTGHYEILGVPYNTLFTLVASASGYKTSYTNNAQVTEANPFKTIDINLTPSPWQYLKLIELNPSPNSNPMNIMRGGIGHRYYQVVDENNVPHNGISVATSPPLHGPFFSSGTIRQGVVSIDVNSLEVTDGQTITITHLNGVALEPAKRKSFVVSIGPLEQEKSWEIRAAGDLGISNLAGEAEGAMEICLSDEQGSDNTPDKIFVSRKALLGGGLSVSAKVGAGAQIGGFGASAAAGVGGSVTAGGKIADKFGYAYETSDLTENIAKLDLLLYPTTLLSPQLVLIQSGLEATLQFSYREEFEAGAYIKGAGSAWGGLVLGSPTANLGIGISGQAEGAVTGTATLIWRKVDEYAVAAEIGGDWRVQGGVLVGGIPLKDSPATGFIPFWEPVGGSASVRFELCFDSNFVLKKIKVALSVGHESGVAGYDVTVDEIEWTITGPPQSLVAIVSPGGILDILLKSLQATSPHIVAFDPHAIVNELDQVFASIQRQGNLSVTYEIKRITGVTVLAPVFDFEIGAGAGIEADVGAGLEGGITETRDLVVQRGKVVGIQMYSTESYSKEIYGPINITLADVYAKALLDVGQQVIQSILDYGEQIVQAGQEVILNAGNSILHIGADVLAEGQRIVNVFGIQAQPKMMGTMRAMSESSPPSESTVFFGIGGTYRLEPADLNLPSPATFTISYSDSDVGSKDESSFRMYRWNDSTGKWEFIGGTVDIINNAVTASIVRFGTYAIGARVEYGKFTFDAEPNEAPSDGNSIITFASEVIRNNDETQVADGKLFTIGVSGGTITTTDSNDSIDGVQIVTNSGILQFTLKAPQVGMKVKAEAVSLSRLAFVTGDVNFVDSNAPQPPTGLQAQIVDGKVLLSWNANSEIDLRGYKIYFDDDTNGAPYNGVAYYSGSNSPVDVAGATSHFLRGLRSGHTYYITLTAYDMSGNESSYGNEIVFVNTLPEDSDSDGMPDSWEIVYTNAANGLDPTANDGMLDNDGDGMTNLEEYLTGHNPLVPDVDGDFNHDRYIDTIDLSTFVSHWLESGCSDPNWCANTDFDHSGTVNFVDFAKFAEKWLWGTKITLEAGDFDGNGKVDSQDLAILADQWLEPPGNPSADIAPLPTGDGIVNFLDFALFAQHWLEGTQ
jgi:hypothetical protein